MKKTAAIIIAHISLRLLVLLSLISTKPPMVRAKRSSPFYNDDDGDDDRLFGYEQGEAAGLAVEGCFNKFDALIEIPPDPSVVGIHNNRRCQFACGTKGYPLAATRSNRTACLCGNDHPSAFHQVDAGKCDAPCSPDKSSCFLHTCCGSRDGQYFIVSFSREQDVPLQVLRQLAFDYHYTSPTFRSKIEDSFVDSSPLLVKIEGGSHINETEEGCEGYVVGGPQCPQGQWVAHQDACYHLHWASALTYDEAANVCHNDDYACLVVPTSDEENRFVTSLQDGCQGWIGLQQDSAKGWKVDTFAAWQNGSVLRINHDMVRPQEDVETMFSLSSSSSALDDDARMIASKSCILMLPSGRWILVGCETIMSSSVNPPAFLCKKAERDCSVDSNLVENGWMLQGRSCYLKQQSGPRFNLTSWESLRDHCHPLPASVAKPTSQEENEGIRNMVGSSLSGLIIGKYEEKEDYSPRWKHYQNWTRPVMHLNRLVGDREDGKATCVQLHPDGGWLHISCGSSTSFKTSRKENLFNSKTFLMTSSFPANPQCFVCKRKIEAILRVSQERQDCWTLTEGCPTGGDEAGLAIRLQHRPTGSFLSCDRETSQLILVASAVAKQHGDQNGFIQETTFIADFDESGSFTLRQKMGETWVMVMWNRASQSFCCVAEGAAEVKPRLVGHEEEPYRSVSFQPTAVLRFLAQQFLRLSVVSLSLDLNVRGRRECSIALFDPSPTTTSFVCRPLSSWEESQANLFGDDLWLEQQALIISDRTRWLRPRSPLPFGRLRCVNESPTQSAICTLAYGRGITIARAITIDFNLLIFDTSTVHVAATASLEATLRTPSEAQAVAAAAAGADPVGTGGGDGGTGTGTGTGGTGDQGGGGGDEEGPGPNEFTATTAATKELVNDFTVAFNNIEEVAIIRAYVETRNWQLSLITRPLTIKIVQFWLEEVTLTYRWRALFQARGSFRLTYFGQCIGSHHSVGDLSNYDDIFFYVFGRYDYPEETSIIVALNGVGQESYPLKLVPSKSIRDSPGY